MESNSTIFRNEYQLGEYTIAYTCDNVRLLEIKVEDKKGIMFVTGEQNTIRGSFLFDINTKTLEVKAVTKNDYKLSNNHIEVNISEDWLGEGEMKKKEHTFSGKITLGEYLINYEEDGIEVVEFEHDGKAGLMFLEGTSITGKFFWDEENATLEMPKLDSSFLNIKDKEIEIAFGWGEGDE